PVPARSGSSAARQSPRRAHRRRPGRPAAWSTPASLLGGQGRGEEVDEQLGNALGLVVVHPVRGIGQALDTVQVGDVVVLGLGEFGAEVAIAFSPDDQGGRLDRVNRRFGLLGRGPY